MWVQSCAMFTFGDRKGCMSHGEGWCIEYLVLLAVPPKVECVLSRARYSAGGAGPEIIQFE